MEDNKITLLIVDDEEAIASAFAKQLKLLGGFDVDIALSGNQGLEMLASGKYSLMLLDLVMPEVDGVEVLRIMKEESGKYPQIPVIVLTNVTSDDARKETGEYENVVKYIVKTDIDPGQLIPDIEKAINPATTNNEE